MSCCSRHYCMLYPFHRYLSCLDPWDCRWYHPYIASNMESLVWPEAPTRVVPKQRILTPLLTNALCNRQLRYTQLMDIETPNVLKHLCISCQALSRPISRRPQEYVGKWDLACRDLILWAWGAGKGVKRDKFERVASQRRYTQEWRRWGAKMWEWDTLYQPCSAVVQCTKYMLHTHQHLPRTQFRTRRN